jgi:hypothetical protein
VPEACAGGMCQMHEEVLEVYPIVKYRKCAGGVCRRHVPEACVKFMKSAGGLLSAHIYKRGCENCRAVIQ